MSTLYEYSYEWDIHYCYENSNVLRNKIGIIDADVLHNAEREISAIRILEAERSPIKGKLDFKHLCSIHRHIFKDLYEWAGKLRSVNISKGNLFCNAEVLDMFGSELFGKLKVERYLLDTPHDQIAKRLAHYLSEINVLHPFREGNGRTQRLFIEYVGLVAGYRVDFTNVTANEMIEASVYAFNRDELLMSSIFERIIEPIPREEQHMAIGAITGTRSEVMRLFKGIQ